VSPVHGTVKRKEEKTAAEYEALSAGRPGGGLN